MRVVSGTLMAAVGMALAGSASADIVGPAADYNVFIFGNGSFSSQNTSTMGNLAVGGNISLMNYSVAQGIAGDSTLKVNPARIVVGGTLTAQNGGVGNGNQNGAIYYGTSAPQLTNFTARGGQFANQSLVDFNSSAAQYEGLSRQLGGLTANGTAVLDPNSGNTLTLTGASAGLNVFSLSMSELAAAVTIDIDAAASATVLINVTGSANGIQQFSNGSVVFNDGVTGAHVLYNFVTASGVNLAAGKDLNGTVLAPEAAVSGAGNLSGQLIAASYSGTTSFTNVEFTGNLPTVPLPDTVWLLLSGLAGVMVVPGLLKQRSSRAFHTHSIG